MQYVSLDKRVVSFVKTKGKCAVWISKHIKTLALKIGKIPIEEIVAINHVWKHVQG